MITSLEKLTRGQLLIPIINPTDCVSRGQSKALMSCSSPWKGHIPPPSPHHQAHSALSAGHPCLGCGSLFHIQSHTHTPKKHSHSKSALAISPQSSTKIKIGRNTQLHTHTHKCPPLSMEQREQDYMPFRLLSPSRKTQLWSSHCHTHAGTRKKVVAPPPSLRYERVIGVTRREGGDTDARHWWCDDFETISQQRRRGKVRTFPHVHGYIWKWCLSFNVL